MQPHFEARQDRLDATSWRVEAIDYNDDGVVYVAVFTGPKAEARAEEYANFKNGVRSEADLNVNGVNAGLRA
jgi:hypothetical protein